MTDSNSNDNNVQETRKIYKFPISLLRLFGINIANLLGRRQFYRWLNKEKSFPSEIADLIEELMVKSIVEEKERKSGAGRLTWVISDRVEFDYFFEYEETSPKTWVWLFYLNTAPDSLKLLVEQLVSKNIPDFRSLNLPFYSSETIIFLEKSAFGEVEVSPSIIEKHLDKFLETNKNYKGRLLLAEYEYYENSEISDDDEDVPDVEEAFLICENWFKGYIPTELKSKSLEKLYSDNLDSKITKRKVKNVLSIKSTETGWSSEDPIFIVSKDLNALVELWDSTTNKISLKWKEWTEFLKKKETLGANLFSLLNQELTRSQLLSLLKTHLQEIYHAYNGLRNIREVVFTNLGSSELEKNNQNIQIINDSLHTVLERCLIWLERLEKCEWEKGDERKDWKEWKKPEYGYQNWKHWKEKLVQYLIELEPETAESTPHSESEKKWEEFFAELSIVDSSPVNSYETIHDESHNTAAKEESYTQEQILYRVQKDN